MWTAVSHLNRSPFVQEEQNDKKDKYVNKDSPIDSRGRGSARPVADFLFPLSLKTIRTEDNNYLEQHLIRTTYRLISQVEKSKSN